MARPTATAAARAAPGRRAPARRSPPRRLSGPAAGGGAVALPGRVLRAPFARAARARAGSVLDALLQGRAWIALVAVLLVGIVFFNVDLLELNRNIAQTADKAARMKRQNADLRLQLARLASSERIQSAAARRGLELPAPGEVRYLRLHSADARRAAARITEPGTGVVTPVPTGTPASGPASAPSPAAATPTAPTTQTPGTQTAPPTTTTTPSSPPPATTPPTAATPQGSPTGGAAPAPTAPATGTGG